ncbi:MAG: hypothetical protein KC415_07500, partial [Anaerolineales bacterium]|nr:hypothetical protein [Anaerolineales bacterium]
MFTRRFVFRIGFWVLLVLIAPFGMTAPVVADSSPESEFQPLEPPLVLPAEANTLEDLSPDYLSQVQTNISTIPDKPDIQAETGLLTSAGAAISFFDDQVAVIADTDTVTDSVRISLGFVPLPDQSEVAYDGGLVSLYVDWRHAITDQPAPVMQKPTHLVLDLRTLNSVPLTGWYVAFQDVNQPDLLRFAPVTVHDATGLISVRVEELQGTLIAGATDLPTTDTETVALTAPASSGTNDPSPWRYQWQAPTVSAFSGAATYQYPIAVPPGRGGLQPNIDIGYSSRGVDGPIISDEIDQGPLGLGWNINNVEISRTATQLWWDGSHYHMKHGDHFSLAINGQNYALKWFSTTNSGTVHNFYALNAPGIRVQQIADAATENVDGVYWRVTTADGTVYRLGFTEDSETGQLVWPKLLETEGAQHEGLWEDYGGLRWRVDTITDVYGNQIQYDYVEWEEPTERYEKNYAVSGDETDITSGNARLSEIRYNFVALASDANTRVSGSYASKITFPNNGHRVDAINLYHGNLGTPYRVVDIGLGQQGHNNYDCSHGEWNSITYLVTYIREETANGAASLPTTTFDYITKKHGTRESADESCWEFAYLEQVENGYGGTVAFTYEGDGRSNYSYIWFDYDGDGDLDWVLSNVPDYGQSYYVTQAESWDGMHGTTAAVTDYTYSAPCYDQEDGDLGNLANASNCTTHDGISGYSYPHGNLVGFEETTVIQYDVGEQELTRQVTRFMRARNMMGWVDWKEQQNDSGAALQKIDTDYVRDQGSYYDLTYASVVRNYQYSNNNTLSTKITYEYDAAYQNGTQYGNITRVNLYDDADATTPYNYTITKYQPNSTDWIVGAPKLVATYDGNDTLLNGAWYYYDDATTQETAPTYGFVTRIRQFQAIQCSDLNPEPTGCVYPRQTIETQQERDVYGNLVSSTSHSAYGYRVYDSGWNAVENTAPWDDPNDVAFETSYTFDGTYHLYPVAATNPAGDVTTFQFYGFNGVALDGFQVQSGLLKQVTEPNGLTTKYEYDPFGRLFAVYDGYSFAGFGDSNKWNGDPLTRYRYWDNTWNNNTTFLNPVGDAPFIISVTQRPSSFPAPTDSNSGYAYADQTFYDGFGRPIQTRSLWNWLDGEDKSREIISMMDYNALGNVTCESVLFDVAFYTDQGKVWPQSPFITDECTSQPHTTTTYDALGRPLTITPPDETTTEYSYYIINTLTVDGRNKLALTNIKDANGHIVGQMSNSLGQLAIVQENEGEDPYTSYSRTRYYYDIQGNLQEVVTTDGTVDGDPVETEMLRHVVMQYDNLGRKTAMDDPDMGEWSYTYDALGSLTEQLDANQQALCFAYDELGRPTQKALGQYFEEIETIDCESPEALATYEYDQLQRLDTFTGTTLPAGWSSNGNVTVNDTVQITGSGDWSDDARRTETIEDGQGIKIRFQFTGTTTTGTASIRAGTYGQSDYRRWGLYFTNTDIVLDIFQGTEHSQEVLLTLEKGVWYEAILTADGNRQFRVAVREENDPTIMNAIVRTFEKYEESDPEWGGLSWTFVSQAKWGTLQLDDYREFDNIDVGQNSKISWSGAPEQNYEVFHYDVLGHLTEHERVIDGRSYTMQYGGFDALHRPTTTTYPDGEVVTVAYDHEGENRLTGNVAGSVVEGITYNAMGQMISFARSNGVNTTYDYYDEVTSGNIVTNNFRLAAIQHGSNNDALPDFNYQYDLVGNITQLTTTNTEGVDTQTFGYDHLNRLVAAEATGGIANYDHTDDLPATYNGYHYDRLGNLTDYGGGNTYDYTTWNSSCSTPLPDQALPHAVKQIGDQFFCYDANGNMTTRSEETDSYLHIFDVENRLTTVTNTVTGDVTQFTYDAAGQRVKTMNPDDSVIYTPFPNYEEEVRFLPPTVILTANGQSALSLPPYTNFTLAWSSSDANSCAASWSPTPPPLTGSESMHGFGSGSQVYTLTCENDYGETAISVTVSIVPEPTVTFTANGQTNLIVPPYSG